MNLSQRALDTIPDPIFVKDRRHVWVGCNEAFCRMLKRPREWVLGHGDPDMVPPEQVELFWRIDDQVFASGTPNENEEPWTGPDGVERTIWTRKLPVRDDEGNVVGLCGMITDITEITARVRRAERLENENENQRALIAAQSELLEAMMLPVVEVWDGVLLIPLVGELTAGRAEQAMQNLLSAVSSKGARFVLLDLTGVPHIDAMVAEALIRAVQGIRLLGCAGILCGIGPDIARTLISLRIDFGGITTCATLRHGLALAIERLHAR